MATLIDEVVNITITRDSVGITRADFGTILILGNSHPDIDPNLKTYTSLAEVTVDYANNSPEYFIAFHIFAQPIKPDKILIGQVKDGETFIEAYNRLSLSHGEEFYAVVSTSLNDDDVLGIAEVVETQSKIFATISADTDIKGDANNNILKQLNALKYNRTYLMYTETPTDWANAAWLGRMLPLQPGSATWAYKELIGINDNSNLNATERANIKLRKGNYFTELAGIEVTFLGTMVSGEYIDVIHGLDWLEAFIQENIAQLLIAAPKIPYNNNGIGLIENSLRASLQEAVLRGIINQDFVITVPDILNVSHVDKVARRLTNVKFTATLTGAIQNIVINGSVTV